MSGRRILFAAHPTVGHTNALVAIARRMRDEGDEVLFALPAPPPVPARLPLPDVLKVGAGLAASIEARGVPVARLRPPPLVMFHAMLLPWLRGYAELRRALTLFTEGAADIARQLVREIDRFGAEVVAADYLMFSAWLAAEKVGVPLATVYHSGLPFPVDGGPPFGSGLPYGAPRDARWVAAERELQRLGDLTDARIARARAELGLPRAAPRLLERPYSPDVNLLLTHRALELPLGELGARTLFTGPCTAMLGDDGSFPWASLREDMFRVYVSLGTVFNTRVAIFERLLRGLDEPGVQVIVSAGASFERLSRRPPHRNALVFRRVPQLALLPRVDLVVAHGGNNSTNETLAAGKPLLVVPFGGEQLQNARRVEALDEHRVRAAFRRLRAEASFSERARAIHEALAGTDGTGAAAAAVRGVARRAR